MEFYQVNKEFFTVIKLAYPVDTQWRVKKLPYLKKVHVCLQQNSIQFDNPQCHFK